MNKKLVVSILIIGGILFLGGISYADELKKSLELYLQDPSMDFLGHEFEKILFEKIKNGDNHFIEELTFILEDIKTMPLQIKAYYNILTQKTNMAVYGSLGFTYGTKVAMGAKEFGEMMFKLFKLVAK